METDVEEARANSPQNVPAIPFDTHHLDGLMDAAGIDALLVTSKHNVQYLLGGYRFFFFGSMDAIGVSRYLPILIYLKADPDRSVYIGNPMESYERELGKFWMPRVEPRAWGTVDAMELAINHLRRLKPDIKRIGVEIGFLPADAYLALNKAMPSCTIVDALVVLERLRARKTSEELRLLREASERVVESMLAVVAGHGAGTTKRQLADALKMEEVARGMEFEYCLITTGTSHNRAPSDERWKEGQILSLDSGGNYHGYIGDLCRMAILGEPDSELEELLAEIEEVQQVARKPIRAGGTGAEIFAAAEAALARSKRRNFTGFMVHGMGLVAHEAPRLTSNGPVPYPGIDAESPLMPGMVLSIETTMLHPSRGFIKLEDTVAVTEAGCEGYGDGGRGWNRGAQT
jgi:Xaa-Pro aminopeptidase